ncbi:Fur family transcriptional regulator [Planctomycetota bacterium]
MGDEMKTPRVRLVEEQPARLMLQHAGLYCTQARLSIVEVLLRSSYPLSQSQIARAMSGSMDKVTIYRTLTCLLNANLLHKAYIQGRAGHYELAHHCTSTQCHPHFTCTQCGQTSCLLDMKMPKIKSPFRGYIIKRQQVRLEGLCPKCVHNKDSDDRNT